MIFLMILILFVSQDQMRFKDACGEVDIPTLVIRVQMPVPAGCPDDISVTVADEVCHVNQWLKTGDPDAGHLICPAHP